MNPFTLHTQQQGVTYLQHLCFACGIAWRLFLTSAIFASHGIFPFVAIRRHFDLEATIRYLTQRNAWIETAKVQHGTSVASGHFGERPVAESHCFAIVDTGK